jgi:Cu+-exporting ATPase
MNKPVDHESISFPVPVEGMSCASCVSSVEKAVSKVAGVDKVSVNLATERADVIFKGAPDLPAVIDAIRKAGYDVPSGSVDLAIEGMSCASCVSKVEKARQRQSGDRACACGTGRTGRDRRTGQGRRESRLRGAVAE